MKSRRHHLRESMERELSEHKLRLRPIRPLRLLHLKKRRRLS